MLKPEEIIAARILMNTNEVFLSSVGAGGGPRSSIITKLRSDGHNVIYFGAPVEFVTDNTLRKQLWHEWCKKTNAIALNEYDFCPMKFTTTEATFWIRNKLSTFTYE